MQRNNERTYARVGAGSMELVKYKESISEHVTIEFELSLKQQQNLYNQHRRL